MSEQSLGDRYNSGKIRWGLVDFDALKPMVEVLEFGAQKYSEWNWSKGLPAVEICESMLRHIYSFLEGNDKDSESSKDEWGHILCNAMFLSHMMRNRPELDNRYKKEAK